MASAAGAAIPVTAFSVRPDPEQIDYWTSLGVSRCIFGLPAASADEILPRVARYAEAMHAVA